MEEDDDDDDDNDDDDDEAGQDMELVLITHIYNRV